ncbi:MAG: PP2C family protein-serine/threonine phosphatase [Candidatus Omnitrophota bacterium]
MKKIPAAYLDDFLKQRLALIKARAQLAATLFLISFFIGSTVTVGVLNEELGRQLVLAWLYTACVFFVTIFVLFRKPPSVATAKLKIVLLVIMILAVLTRYYIVISEPPFNVAMVFIFTLIGLTLIFPWLPWHIITLLILHVGAYIVFLMNVPAYVYKNDMVATDVPDYLQGFVIMFLAFFVCYIVTRYEREREIENFILLKELEAKSRQMQKELDLATRVHKTLIPKSLRTDLVDIAVMYLPMYYIGGDYAKFYFIDKHKLIFIICDVTGHGVSAALMVNRLHAEFMRLANAGKEPGTLLKELNDFISADFEGTNMYLSAFCGLLDFRMKKLIYSNHGHPPQYIYKITESDIRQLSAQTSFLGIDSKEDVIYQNEVDFSRGDRVLLFTDGVTETKDKDKQEYGPRRLEDFIRKNRRLPVEIFNQNLLDELNAFRYGAYADDVFILALQIK